MTKWIAAGRAIAQGAGKLIAPLAAKWAPVALALLVTALVGWGGFATWQWRSTEAELADAQIESRLLSSAARQNAATARDVQSRLMDEVQRQRLSLEAEREANRQLEIDTRQARDRAERARRELESIYAQDRDCSDWRDDPVCDGVADWLRDHYADPGASDSGGAGSDRGADPG